MVGGVEKRENGFFGLLFFTGPLSTPTAESFLLAR